MPKFVLDTNVYIRATRDSAWNEALETFVSRFAPWLYLHSVVGMEVLSGATTPGLADRTHEAFLTPLERRGRVFTPTHDAWKREGLALARLISDRKVSRNGIRRSLINDLLIAASARDHGFVLITENSNDFELISDLLPVEHATPWPDPQQLIR